MRAGELRHRVTIQQPVESRNSFGEVTVTWQDVATVWAAIEPLRGREFWEARQTVAEMDVRIRIRYRSGITPKMRVVWGSKVYDIESVIDVESRRKELHLMCREMV